MSENHRSVAVRAAVSEELPSIMTVIDGALLAIDAATVRAQIHAQGVLVAVADGSILGVIVLDENHIDAIAVRRSQRGNGIGTALVGAANEHSHRPLTADFRPSVSPFYESLGFEIERSGTRWRGVKPAVR